MSTITADGASAALRVPFWTRGDLNATSVGLTHGEKVTWLDSQPLPEREPAPEKRVAVPA